MHRSFYPMLAGLAVLFAARGAVAGPAFGLGSLPSNRPISVAYLNALRSATDGSTSYTASQIPAEMTGLNWAGFAVVV